MVQIHFVKTASFLDFARYVCAFREYPLRVYAHQFNRKMILACRLVLSNSIISFYTDYQNGRYVEYSPKNGKDKARVVNSIQSNSVYAPIIHLDSLPFKSLNPKKIQNKLKIFKVLDLGNLARLTYDPEWPDDQKITFLCFEHKKKWMVGYVTTIELDETLNCFYYVELDSKPTKPFIKYSGHRGLPTEFTDKFQHGFPYFPLVELKESHPVFGLRP